MVTLECQKVNGEQVDYYYGGFQELAFLIF